jgi:hypothetical protein
MPQLGSSNRPFPERTGIRADRKSVSSACSINSFSIALFIQRFLSASRLSRRSAQQNKTFFIIPAQLSLDRSLVYRAELHRKANKASWCVRLIVIAF